MGTLSKRGNLTASLADMSMRNCLHPINIANATDDKALFELLASELNARLEPVSNDMEALHVELMKLPCGLRAMGATHMLDVSMALEDLGWHFGRWPSHALAQDTLEGLKELGALEERNR